MTLPRISIVTPSYNQGQFLEQTICSVLDQGYPNLQYFVMDGGSTDNSVEIIKKYEKHLTGWESAPDRGQSHAVNKGILLANGDVFNWLNSDDYYEPGVLQEVAEIYQAGARVVCGRVRFRYPDGSHKISGPFPHSEKVEEVIASTKYLQPSTFYNMQFIKLIKGLNESLHYCMDFELWMKYLLLNGLEGVKMNDKIIVNFRWHDTSKSTSAPERFHDDLVNVFSSLQDGSAAYSVGITKDIIDRAASIFFYDRAVHAYGKRDFVAFDAFGSRVQERMLNPERQKEWKRMTLRRKSVPAWIYRLIG